MKKQLILFIILVLIVFLINRYYKNNNNVNLNTIKNNNEIKLFANVNLNKLMPTLVRNKNNLEEVKYVKSRSKDINFYTLSSLPDFGKFENTKNYENNYMTIFTDKPYRSMAKIMLEHGLDMFVPKNSKHKIIDDTPNAVLNLLNNGKNESFIVSLTNVEAPLPNNKIAYFRGDSDDHYLSPFDDNEIIRKTRDNVLLKKLEDNVKNEQVKKSLKNIYGDKFLDYVLRTCKFTFAFLDKIEEKHFEKIMKEDFKKYK